MFSPHATSTKHSTSAKLASLAGLSLPTETVYVFLCFFFSSARRCFKSGSDPADKIARKSLVELVSPFSFFGEGGEGEGRLIYQG